MHPRISIAPASDDPTRVAEIAARARAREIHRFVVPVGVPFHAEPGDEVDIRTPEGLKLTGGGPTAPIVRVDDPAALDRELARIPDGGTVVVEWGGDRVIPLENAVAHRGRRFHLWTVVRSPEEAPAALGALEHGADRVIVSVHAPSEIDRLETLLDRPASPDLPWVRVPLRAVTPAGLGDRVLVDTTSLLRPEEGMLVGSASALLFHVASEAVGSRFSRARPFRVNAGAAHSYALMADGTTRYLSELDAGDAVLVATVRGAVRPVRVGRIKIERRPMVMLRADDDGRSRTIFLQEAETVRLSAESGRVPVTEIAPGREVEAVRMPAARHLGAVVQETIEER